MYKKNAIFESLGRIWFMADMAHCLARVLVDLALNGKINK